MVAWGAFCLGSFLVLSRLLVANKFPAGQARLDRRLSKQLTCAPSCHPFVVPCRALAAPLSRRACVPIAAPAPQNSLSCLGMALLGLRQLLQPPLLLLPQAASGFLLTKGPWVNPLPPRSLRRPVTLRSRISGRCRSEVARGLLPRSLKQPSPNPPQPHLLQPSHCSAVKL